MRPKDIAVIAVRLIAVYMLMPAAFNLSQFIMIGQPVPASEYAGVATELVAALILWASAPALSRMMTRSTQPLGQVGLDLAALVEAGAAVAGIVLVVQALDGVAISIGNLLGAPALLGRTPPMFVMAFAGSLTQVVLGALLFLLRRPLARAVARARTPEVPLPGDRRP